MAARRRQRLVEEQLAVLDVTGAATPEERRSLARALIEAKVTERVEKLDGQVRTEMAAIGRQDPDVDVQIEYDPHRRG